MVQNYRSLPAAAWLAVALAIQPPVAFGQDAPVLIERRGDIDTQVLFGVKDAAVRLNAVAVLTEPSPAVHLFQGSAYLAWGEEGGGPAELRTPVDLRWVSADIVVLDMNQHKLVTYGQDGTFKGSRSLGNAWASRFYVVNGDTLLGTFVPMTRDRVIVRVRGRERTPVITYQTSERQIRLEAPGAPSLTLQQPYTPEPQWTVLSDGLIVFWAPGRDYLELLRLDGSHAGSIEGVGGSLEVRSEDREHWFQDAIPEDFMGQPVFEPLRQIAREQVEFPKRLPPVLELAEDPRGGVWIRKSTEGSGEVWALRNRDGEEAGSLRFPAGRRVLVFANDRIVAFALGELDVEQIEVYARPAWAE